MPITRITIRPSIHPDPEGENHLYDADGEYMGKMTYTARQGSTTSTHTNFPGGEYEPIRLKRKHRKPR